MMTSREGLNSMSCTCTPRVKRDALPAGDALRGLASFAKGNKHVADTFSLL
jgi:hypothetical protein